ncbi:MAG: hypothetical protein M3O74_13630 [Pseudomonadota bacterium]|nr:hypothetical protein [Pseudomonadota bacterium]
MSAVHDLVNELAGDGFPSEVVHSVNRAGFEMIAYGTGDQHAADLLRDIVSAFKGAYGD